MSNFIATIFFFSLLHVSNFLFAQKDEIVIVNLGHNDRNGIADILLKINSCNPKVVGIVAIFRSEKKESEDAALVEAFSTLKNDVLCYNYDGAVRSSHPKFSSLCSDSGFVEIRPENEYAIYFVPIQTINGIAYTNMALTLAKKWNPKVTVKTDSVLLIRYEKDLSDLIHLEGEELNPEKHKKLLEHKIVLLGYIGPEKSDKFLVPDKKGRKKGDQMYGVIILANEILTLIH